MGVELPRRDHPARPDAEHPLRRFDAAVQGEAGRAPGHRDRCDLDDPEAAGAIIGREVEGRGQVVDDDFGAVRQRIDGDPARAVVERDEAMPEAGAQQAQPAQVGGAAEHGERPQVKR